MTATDQATQFKYTPRYQPNQLICGNGQTAVVTGWTVKQAIAKHLQPQEFAVIGQLYSPTRGISFLLRNLLANPHVRYLVILNATKEDGNAGACECLLDFFRNGFVEGSSDTGRKCWVICSTVRGYIDIEIDATALEQLRESVKCEEVKSIAQAVSKVKFYAQQGIVKPWGQQREFPYSTVVPSVLPGQRYGHRIEGKTIAETWVKIIHRIKTTGTIRPSRYDSQWQELIDLTAIVTQEPRDFYFPEPNYLPCDRSFINQYISQILGEASQEKASSEEVIEYTYGQRLRSWFERDQIEQVIQKLSHQIDSASAVMSLWDVRDHETDKSPPCLNHIWVRVVDNELSLTATFRSNDMFSAWPANAIGLRALQQHIRDAIANRCCDSEAVATLGASAQIAARSKYDLKMGPLITVSQSAHIYDDCWENADQLIQSQYFRICQQRDYTDPSGNFVITLRDGKICVEHMTPGSGEVVNCYSGKSAIQLYRQIAADCPSLQVEHAMYLGTELQKAELSLSAKQGFVYEQDKPLMLTEKLTSIDNQVLKVKLLSEKAQLPQYAHPGDSGLDLFSTKEALIQPGESTLIPTGISIELPPETEAQIRPRSGLALKHQVTVLNTPGTIDQGYRGEIGVILINHGKMPFHVEIGMKIAQMVIQPVLSMKVKNVEELDKTDRGAGGFGSTGI